MKPKWRKSVGLLLAAVYLTVVAFGHGFHNHRHAQDDTCQCKCHANPDNHQGNADHRGGDTSDGLGSARGRTILAKHACPVCNFFSHTCVPVTHAQVVTTRRVPEQLARAACPTVTDTCRSSHQPRGPPRLA